MQQIDRDSARAFWAGDKYHNTNTTVSPTIDGESILELWGSTIAWTSNGRSRLNVCLQGWDTRTTANRLRALGVAIEHKLGRLYINGQQANAYDTYRMGIYVGGLV